MSEADSARFQTLVEELARKLDADRCTLYAVDAPSQEVRSIVALGLEIAGIRISMRRGLVGYVARTGNSLMLKDVYNDPRFDRSIDRQTGYRSKSALTMAIRGEGNRIVGVVQALNKKTEVFTATDEQIMRDFCDEIAPLLSLAEAS